MRLASPPEARVAIARQKGRIILPAVFVRHMIPLYDRGDNGRARRCISTVGAMTGSGSLLGLVSGAVADRPPRVLCLPGLWFLVPATGLVRPRSRRPAAGRTPWPLARRRRRGAAAGPPMPRIAAPIDPPVPSLIGMPT